MNEIQYTLSVSEKNKLIDFTEITKCDSKIAKVYLNSTNWNMDSALARFFDEEADDQPLNDPGPSTSTSNNRQPKSRTMIFKSFKNAIIEDSDDEEDQRSNAHGITASDQQAIRPLHSNADIITHMFQTAQKNAGSSSSAHDNGASIVFVPGYKLGQTDNDTEVIPSHNSTAESSSNRILLKLWKNGFTVNDGELQSIDQPKNRKLINQAVNGVVEKIPFFLLGTTNVSSEDQLVVKIEIHNNKNYVPCKQVKKNVGGSGTLLESSTLDVVGDKVLKEVPLDDDVANEANARAEVPLTPGAPTTSLQIRLVDDTRILATFNQSHTIGDVRRYIIAARSSFASRSFKLQSLHPQKILNNDGQTLSEAGLLNSVISQCLI